MMQIWRFSEFGRCISRRSRPSRQLGFERLENRELLALVIDPGMHQLLPNTPDQAVLIMVTRTAPAVDPAVSGFNLRAQLGDGSGPATEPIFAAVDFGGGIWAAYATTTVGGPLAGSQQLAQASVVFTNQGVAVPPEGLVVTLIISTAGITEGSYPLRLAATEIGADSDFIGLQATLVPASTAEGTIQIATRPWQNQNNHLDVDNNGSVIPLDVLLVINDINLNKSRTLPMPPIPPQIPPPYLDVNGDGDCTPLDVLQIVNFINSRPATPPLTAAAGVAGAEGESSALQLAAKQTAADGTATAWVGVTDLVRHRLAREIAQRESPDRIGMRPDGHSRTSVSADDGEFYDGDAAWRLDW